MAIQTFYPQAALASSSNHLSMTEVDPVTIALLSPNTGWHASTIAPPRICLMDSQFEVPSTSGDWLTAVPAGSAPNNTRGDSFRTPSKLTGSYAAGSWALGRRFGAVTSGFSGRMQLLVRVWRSSDPTGAVATEITTSDIILGPTTTNIPLGSSLLISGAWFAPAFTLTDEYLFFQEIFEQTLAASGGNADVNYYQGPEAKVTTTEFTPGGVSPPPPAAAMVEYAGMVPIA